MKYSPVKPNFKYPEITPEHYRFGSNQLVGPPLVEDGNWEMYLPPYELQNRNGLETSTCFIQAQQHTIATLLEEKYEEELDNNFSERFNLIYSDASPYGGDPLKAAESIRKQGLIPDILLPFSDDLKTWDEFCSFKGSNELECTTEGELFLDKWKLNYDIVFTRDEPVEYKYKKLRQALKYSPVPISVLGWYQDDNGDYIKPKGTYDNHFTECFYLDNNNCPYVLDTYKDSNEQFIKKLSPFYNSDFAMRWSITKLEESKISLWQKLIKWYFDQKWIFRTLERKTWQIS